MTEENGTRHRSPKAPSTPLGHCVEHIRELYQLYSRSPMMKSDVASALGYSSTSGTFMKLLATLRGFGLLEKAGKKQFRISEFAIRLKNEDLATRAGQELALETIGNAQVFASLLNRFDGKLPPKESIARRLEEDMGFSEAKANDASDVLEESLGFAGVLDGQRNIVLTKADIDSQGETPGSGLAGSDSLTSKGKGQGPEESENTPTQGRMDIPVSAGRFVRIQYPSDLTAVEAERVRSILGLLVVEEGESVDDGKE